MRSSVRLPWLRIPAAAPGQPATPDNIADSTVAWMPRWQNLKNPVYMGGGCGEFPGYYGQIEGFGGGMRESRRRNLVVPCDRDCLGFFRILDLPSPR